METRIMQPFAVACRLSSNELSLRVYEAETREEALGLALFDIQQSKLKGSTMSIIDFKVVPAKEDALTVVALQELQAGGRIRAIKEVHTHTGWDLRRSKEFVDILIQERSELDV